MIKRLKHFTSIDNSVAIFLLLVIMLYSVFAPTMGKVEGDHFPVTIDFEISNVTSINGFTEFDVEFNKVRDCDWKGVTWYHYRHGYAEKLTVQFLTDMEYADQSDENRELGRQLAGRWRINIPREYLPNTIGRARHFCHGLWYTDTILYP